VVKGGSFLCNPSYCESYRPSARRGTLYERGDLVGQLAFADLKKQALINEKAKAADRDPEFSHRIREGVIGFQPETQ
jgi:hypothetical protein